jgi:hypothetical protein
VPAALSKYAHVRHGIRCFGFANLLAGGFRSLLQSGDEFDKYVVGRRCQLDAVALGGCHKARAVIGDKRDCVYVVDLGVAFGLGDGAVDPDVVPSMPKTTRSCIPSMMP